MVFNPETPSLADLMEFDGQNDGNLLVERRSGSSCTTLEPVNDQGVAELLMSDTGDDARG